MTLPRIIVMRRDLTEVRPEGWVYSLIEHITAEHLRRGQPIIYWNWT